MTKYDRGKDLLWNLKKVQNCNGLISAMIKFSKGSLRIDRFIILYFVGKYKTILSKLNDRCKFLDKQMTFSVD